VRQDNFTLGFKTPELQTNSSDNKNDIRHHINADDLVEYGFIPEFVGRLPVPVTLDELLKDDLIKVLTEPKNAFIKQYQALFEMDEVSLEFTSAALEAAAEKAIEQNTGARGLRSILEKTLLDTMYELPSLKGKFSCVVDANSILGTEPIKIVESNNGELVDLQNIQIKSAS